MVVAVYEILFPRNRTSARALLAAADPALRDLFERLAGWPERRSEPCICPYPLV